MLKGLPSVTAVIVASARAIASSTQAASCDPGDRMARELLPGPVRAAVDLVTRSEPHARWLPRAVSVATLGMLDHLALRARAIDEALYAALDRGIKQVVILGAGLDTRSYRIAALAGARVFEVDHPDSQAQKRARVDRLQPMAAEVIHVPVDFVRDALGPALRQHGHDPSVPTFWIWEGVVPYLREPAIESTLRVISELSAAGSELAVTYVTRGLFWMRGDRKLVTYAMHLIGEPVHSALDPEHMAQLLTAAGLSVTSDTGTRNWQERFARPGAQRRVVTYEHLALAVRR